MRKVLEAHCSGLKPERTSRGVPVFPSRRPAFVWLLHPFIGWTQSTGSVAMGHVQPWHGSWALGH